MKLTHLKDMVKRNNKTKKVELPFLSNARTAVGTCVIAAAAVGAVGICAFVGGHSIPENAADKKTDAANAHAIVSDQTDTDVTQVALTFHKAGMGEYGLVSETIRATESGASESLKKYSSAAAADLVKGSAKAAGENAGNASEAAEEKKTEPEKKTEEVNSCAVMKLFTTEKMNMRENADTDSKVITIIEPDQEVLVTGYTGDWYRIKYDSKTGYCMKRYLTDENPADKPAQSVISYTDTEFDMLCYVLQNEVGDCSEQSKIAVANVIINRVKSSAFPDSVEGVLTQGDQFTAIYNYYSGVNVPTDNTRDCARRALMGENNIGGATYYYAPNYCGGYSTWFESLSFCAEIDGQRFFM